jgi:putative copper export protein
MRPSIAWANPPMHLGFAAAFLGGLGLFAGDPTLPVGVRVAAEGTAWLLCVRGKGLVAVPAVLAALVLPLSGHASGAGAVSVDALHVLSAAMWGGGILALVTLRPPEGWRSAEARQLVERFGRVAVIAFAITALTGFFRATEQLDEVSQLWTTTYGVVLALKVAAVLLLIAWSTAWRRGWAPAWAEGALAVLILLLTAVLAAIPPPPLVEAGIAF